MTSDMKPLLAQSLLLLDGGLGTTLEDEHNVKFSNATPLWSSDLLIESPSILHQVHRDFIAAGANIVITATYQASLHGFANTRTQEDGAGISQQNAEMYMRSAVNIARSAFDGRPGLVALSLGAYGATMVPSTEYSGEYGSMTESDLFDFHRDRLKVFIESDSWSGVDIVAIETLPRLDEVRATHRLMQNVPDKPYWISCVFPNDDKLPDGSSINVLTETMLSGTRPPYAIGINCTKVHKISDLVRKFEKAAEALNLRLPRLVIYPDGTSGKVYDTKLQQWIGTDVDSAPWDEQMHAIVQEIQSRDNWKGILVGGCCKASPLHIQKLRERLRN